MRARLDERSERAVGVERLGEPAGRLSPVEQRAVDDALALVLALA